MQARSLAQKDFTSPRGNHKPKKSNLNDVTGTEGSQAFYPPNFKSTEKHHSSINDESNQSKPYQAIGTNSSMQQASIDHKDTKAVVIDRSNFGAS